MTDMNPLVGGLLNIHKIISRGINVSIRKCDEYLGKRGIPAEEVAGFPMYVTALRWVTHAHHLSEDEIAFPFFKDHIEAPFDRLKADHETMAGILEALDQSLVDLSSGRVDKLREVLGEFEKLWVPHIKIEEENFTLEKVQTFLGINEQSKLAEKLAKHGSKNSGPGPIVVPFFFYNLEAEDREILMMHFPWIVKKVLVPIIWKSKWKAMSPFLL